MPQIPRVRNSRQGIGGGGWRENAKVKKGVKGERKFNIGLEEEES